MEAEEEGVIIGILDVNPNTDKVYVADWYDDKVSIDGSTNRDKTITVDVRPSGVAINPLTNLTYISNDISNIVALAGASAHALKSIKPDATVMIVEPFANDKTEDNLNPLGRIFYAASTMLCVPASMAYNGPALGAQAGEIRLSEVVKAGGFKHFKRATQTSFNIVYEAKPQ